MKRSKPQYRQRPPSQSEPQFLQRRARILFGSMEGRGAAEANELRRWGLRYATGALSRMWRMGPPGCVHGPRTGVCPLTRKGLAHRNRWRNWGPLEELGEWGKGVQAMAV